MMKPYYQREGITLYCGDCLEVMRELPSESVQCVVTSPPYDNLRVYGGHSWDFECVAHELKRVVCDGGIVCWNVGDSVVDGSETLTSFKQAIYFKDMAGFRVHDTMIYRKRNFSHPERMRYHQIFEYVFIFSNGEPRCFNPIRDKRNRWSGSGTFGKNTIRERDGSMTTRKRNIINELGIRGNVWDCKTAGQENVCKALPHPAMMPFDLCRDLILSWSNPGDTVFDPFFGSGTTGAACVQTGRKCIGIEVNKEYCEIAAKRIDMAFAHPACPPLPQEQENECLPLLEEACR